MTEHGRVHSMEEAPWALAEGNFAVRFGDHPRGANPWTWPQHVQREAQPALQAETAAIPDACTWLTSEEMSGATLYTIKKRCPEVLLDDLAGRHSQPVSRLPPPPVSQPAQRWLRGRGADGDAR